MLVAYKITTSHSNAVYFCPLLAKFGENWMVCLFNQTAKSMFLWNQMWFNMVAINFSQVAMNTSLSPAMTPLESTKMYGCIHVCMYLSNMQFFLPVFLIKICPISCPLFNESHSRCQAPLSNDIGLLNSSS